MVSIKWQVFTWTNDDPINLWIYTSAALSELKRKLVFALYDYPSTFHKHHYSIMKHHYTSLETTIIRIYHLECVWNDLGSCKSTFKFESAIWIDILYGADIPSGMNKTRTSLHTLYKW